MRVANRTATLGVLFFLFVNMALMSAPLDRTVSTSRQFIIYGTKVPLRGLVSDLAEQTKASLLRILQQRDDWKTPIVVNLQFPQANLPEMPPAELHFSQTGFGLKLQLNLTMADAGNASSMQRELLRAILLEMIYRNRRDIAPGTVFVHPPDWLLEGILAMAPGQEKLPLMEAMAPLVNSEKIIPVEEFLRLKPANLDSPAKLLYRSYALALLQFLLDQPDGRSRLSAYIGNLSRASNDQLADLKGQFPALTGGDFDALWKSHVTKFAARDNLFQLLTFGETDEKLDQLLSIRVPDAAGSGKEMHWENLLRKKLAPVQAATLGAVSQNLTVLAASANPLMRPIVGEYQQIVELLVRGKRAGLVQRLTRLKKTRAQLVARMSDIDDYMNWFEATQLNTRSGAFADYLKAAAESAQPKRRDALSVYLDAMEEQFQD
jgi:hypothetical protein